RNPGGGSDSSMETRIASPKRVTCWPAWRDCGDPDSVRSMPFSKTLNPRSEAMPITSVTSDAESLTLTVVGDYPVPIQRLWDAYADPRQLEKFWGPEGWPATFTRHDMAVGGMAQYYMT